MSVSNDNLIELNNPYNQNNIELMPTLYKGDRKLEKI